MIESVGNKCFATVLFSISLTPERTYHYRRSYPALRHSLGYCIISLHPNRYDKQPEAASHPLDIFFCPRIRTILLQITDLARECVEYGCCAGFSFVCDESGHYIIQIHRNVNFIMGKCRMQLSNIFLCLVLIWYYNHGDNDTYSTLKTTR